VFPAPPSPLFVWPKIAICEFFMNIHKIGRNDNCPCGSGRKFKKCHGTLSTKQAPPESFPPVAVRLAPTGAVPQEVLARALTSMRQHQLREQERTRRYGLVRPLIAADFHGFKFVAIGSTLLYMPSDKCRFLTDVLITYVPHLFGREWFDQEIAKPPDERHVVMQWRIKGMNYMNAQPREPDGTYSATPTGPLLAYLTFAYDLFVVAHNGRLDCRLVERLKQKDQFQGARHELFAEATCLRAGFQIEREDESDRSIRHAEFTAKHIATGQMISVEAKSKHRPGVLGQAGVREPNDSVSLRFGHLLNDAVAKNPAHPLVVFLDMNMPFETANRFLTPQVMQPGPHPYILQTLDRMKKQFGGRDPITQLVITNHPGHYTGDHEIPRRPHMVCQIPLRPLKPARMEALLSITEATNLYGNIPQELPGDFSPSRQSNKTPGSDLQRRQGPPPCEAKSAR